MTKATAIMLLGHRNSDVRGIAGAIVDGLHQQYGILNDALQDAGDFYSEEWPMRFEEGKSYYVETLTKYYVGRVVSCNGAELVLEDAAWIADTGLMTDFIKTGKSENLEVEVIGEIGLPVGMITAKCPWPHKLFMERK